MENLMIQPTHVLLGAILLFTSRSFADQPRPSPLPAPGVFPIVSTLGPPASLNTLEHWGNIKKANFTVTLPGYQYDVPSTLTMLDHCQKLGLRAVVNVKLLPRSLDEPLAADYEEQVKQVVATYADRPALLGYFLKDEPNAAQFPQIGRVHKSLLRHDPLHTPCVNLFPSHATPQQLGTPTYREHLEQYMQTVQPVFLCYDHYPFLISGLDRPDFFFNLEEVRRASLKYNTPAWNVILAKWHAHFREPTEGQMRWQVYGSLAYGIKGILYFTYWPVPAGKAGIVDHQGAPQPLYGIVSRLNGEMLALGRTLLTLESTAVYHTGKTLPEGCTRLPDNGAVSVDQDSPLVVGFFDGPGDSRYVMIVNRDYDRAINVTVRYAADITGVAQVSNATGLAEPVSLVEQRTVHELLPGGGVLLRLDGTRR